MPRAIIHLDLDAFYCAVEEQHHPDLRGKPFAVGGKPSERGVVASCSYPARAVGVRSAMPMSRAMRLCPGLIIVPPHFERYRAASQQVMARLHALTPLVEQISIDEAFLDVTALPDPPATLARQLQATIHADLNLPCSLGLATNKLIAKIASDHGKSLARGGGPPNAITLVPPGTEAEFLAPLPVDRLWGVGPKTAARLHEMGITTIGALAQVPETELARRFGKNGEEMSRHARGLDDRPIVTEHETKSISQEITFSRDVTDPSRLRAVIHEQSESIAHQLQKETLEATTIKLKLRWPDFSTLSRQTTLSQPFSDAPLIAQTAWRLLEKVWQPGKPIRLLGVGVSGLGTHPHQLSLWQNSDPKPMTNLPPASQALLTLHIPHRVFTHPGPVTSLEQAAQERGQHPDQVIRSILFRLSEAEFLMVLMAGPAQIPWKALRKHVGSSRLTLASEDEVRAVTGTERGAVGPFGLPAPIRILVDASVLSQTEISLGSGVRGTTIILQVADMMRGLGEVEVVEFKE